MQKKLKININNKKRYYLKYYNIVKNDASW